MLAPVKLQVRSFSIESWLRLCQGERFVLFQTVHRLIPMKYIRLVYLLLFLITAGSMAQASAPTPTFASGERWCALGDSITQGGYYVRYIELFYCTRFPLQKIDVINCGINGDTALAALKRLQWDCLDAKPTAVSVMLGMNDVGRSFFRLPPAEQEKRRAGLAEGYEQGIRKLTSSLKGAGVKVVLIKPSIYDDTADLPTANGVGCGAALADFANRMQVIANEMDVAIVDFNTPMAVINAGKQKDDPYFSIVGPDRVHPTQPGHMVMAYEFLRAQKASGVVSQIVVDAAEGKAGLIENCEVTKIGRLSNGVSFTCLEKALPFPVETNAVPALEFVPFMKEFNRQILVVDGLQAGTYELSIDGKKIRAFTAAELAAGVNLAEEKNTPQLQQSVAVQAAFARKWQAESRLRSIAFLEHNVWPEENRPLPIAEVFAGLDQGLIKIAGKNTTWAGMMRKNYTDNKPRQIELQREAEEAAQAARMVAQPKSHEFLVQRLAR